jgi:hypothetical protein
MNNNSNNNPNNSYQISFWINATVIALTLGFFPLLGPKTKTIQPTQNPTYNPRQELKKEIIKNFNQFCITTKVSNEKLECTKYTCQREHGEQNIKIIKNNQGQLEIKIQETEQQNHCDNSTIQKYSITLDEFVKGDYNPGMLIPGTLCLEFNKNNFLFETDNEKQAKELLYLLEQYSKIEEQAELEYF